MKRILICSILILLFQTAGAENYLINGGQTSTIKYELTQNVVPTNGTELLKLSFVVPVSFSSPTYNQTISGYSLNFNPPPSNQTEETDKRGNKVVRVEWKNPRQPIDVSMVFTASNKTILQQLQSTAAFPVQNIPPDLRDYLKPTKQVQSGNSGIAGRAESLVQGVTTEFDAVQKILTWVVDNMHYVTPPQQYDALYSFNSGKGNCQNYSHLAAALMRHAGIPVRIVNGVTLKEPYTIKTPQGEFTFKMGQGRHSWIEVWFPDLGWVPFDPQQTQLFVSNRFVRLEVGVDNEEAVQDGTVRWRQAKGVQGKPSFQEAIEGNFVSDQVQLAMEKQAYGPKNMLLTPKVIAKFTPVKVETPPPPQKVPTDQLKILQYTRKLIFGNLEFPKNMDFLETRGPAQQETEDEYAMTKNFMVETAEYVTTKLTQYAQVFILEKPMKLAYVSLALHKFGGSGQIWLDLMQDENGKPGSIIATSDFMSLDDVKRAKGYDWVNFDFTKSDLKLSPGNYWIGLGFTGSPIINWFYTYGKPVGPVEGTRYKGVYDSDWSGALSYEFNYRVMGYAAQ